MRKRSVAGILCSSLFLTVISATVLGKTTTVVYAADVEKYTNADFAMDTVVSETLYTSGEDINTQIGEKLREMETTLLSWTEENSQISQLNNADGKTMEVSDELAADLRKFASFPRNPTVLLTPPLEKSSVCGTLTARILMSRTSPKLTLFFPKWDTRKFRWTETM
ncbi:MAG: FAD:protein FMN transferase [Blautia faecis]